MKNMKKMEAIVATPISERIQLVKWNSNHCAFCAFCAKRLNVVQNEDEYVNSPCSCPEYRAAAAHNEMTAAYEQAEKRAKVLEEAL